MLALITNENSFPVGENTKGERTSHKIHVSLNSSGIHHGRRKTKGGEENGVRSEKQGWLLRAVFGGVYIRGIFAVECNDPVQR